MLQYLKLFNSKTEYDNYIIQNNFHVSEPNVSCVLEENDKPYYNADKIIPIEYLESSGTQYIDTGVVVSNLYDFEIQFSLPYIQTTAQGSNMGTIFGSRKSWNSQVYHLTTYNKNTSAVGHFAYNTQGWNNGNTPVANITANAILTIKKVGNAFYSANNTKTNLPTGSFTGYGSLCIFALKENNNVQEFSRSLRIHSFKLYNNNTLVHDYIPVKKNGIGYLYDKVTNELLGNLGTGEFICGPTKYYDYEVEYLQGNGNAYINTNYCPNSNTILKLKYSYSATTQTPIFVRYNIDSNTTCAFGLYISANSSNGNVYYYGVEPDKMYKKTGLSTSTIIDATLDINKIIVNDVESSITRSEFNIPIPIYIFRGNINNVVSNTSDDIRIYSCVIIENNEIIMDLIPVVKDGIGYMFDRISKQLFGNMGDGSFVLGPSI